MNQLIGGPRDGQAGPSRITASRYEFPEMAEFTEQDGWSAQVTHRHVYIYDGMNWIYQGREPA